MNIQSSNGTYAYDADTVVAFAPSPKQATPESVDQLDKAGQTILRLLHKAAGVAEENNRHALDMAQRLSHQLRDAEDGIAELEAEIGLYKDKADRAEEWLHRVYSEIADRFLRQDNSRAGMTGAPQRQGSYASR
jgi:hypothetical protein